MKSKFHLTVNEKGAVRVSKGKPDLRWDEVSIEMNLQIPDLLFQRPSLQAQVSIPESAAAPKLVDIEMQNNIQDAIRQVSGMEVRLTIEPSQND